MGAVYHRGRIPSASTSESHRGDLIIQRYDWSDWRVGLLSAYIRFREPDKSEDEAEGRTSVESSIPCFHGGRALVVKRAEEVENAEANSKYQDRVEGQRPRNFIRPKFDGSGKTNHMGFLADVGGLYAISLAIFLFVLVQLRHPVQCPSKLARLFLPEHMEDCPNAY
ncbi:hypothetical protein GW17_00026440 [Ensete ventricosum]|nr:hypothetical protein GW17_00026440 [Ensete ventricosum]